MVVSEGILANGCNAYSLVVICGEAHSMGRVEGECG
jgi:hypothetical protein